MQHEEWEFQKQIVQYLKLNHIFVFSVVNEGVKNIKTAIIHKQQGLMAGVSDLIVLMPNQKTYFLELKTEKGKQNDNQKAFQEQVEEMGFTYLIIRRWEDIENFVKKYK